MRRFFALCLLASALTAGDPLQLKTLTVRTLPAESYGQMKKGGGSDQFSWAWKDPSFKGSEGFRLDELRYVADERNGHLQTYLRDQLANEERRSGGYALNLAVTYYTVDSIGPQIILEGTLSNGGKPVARFVESLILDPGVSPLRLVDGFMRDFSNFRM